jgi:hypothetical protein
VTAAPRPPLPGYPHDALRQALASPRLTDAEARLLGWLAAKPEGYLLDAEEVMEVLGRARTWVTRARAGLHRQGYLFFPGGVGR